MNTLCPVTQNDTRTFAGALALVALSGLVLGCSGRNTLACGPGLSPVEVCGDGRDNDGDGLVDEGCLPSQCQPPAPELCGDGLDNDGDGLVDEDVCADSECVPQPERCADGIDNDCDTQVDEGADCVAACQGHLDCERSEVCQWETGRCQAPGPDECGSPAAEGGGRGWGESCGPGDCSLGLSCLTLSQIMDRQTGVLRPRVPFERLAGSGYCFHSCDPCAPVCPDGMACAVSDQFAGGFCSPPMASLGERCGASRPCVTGLSCEGVCIRACTPDDSTLWSTDATRTGTESVDCAPGEVCTAHQWRTDGAVYLCQPGPFAETGEVCGTCHWPETCVSFLGPGRCGQRCDLDPSVCPEGSDCIPLAPGVSDRALCLTLSSEPGPAGTYCLSDSQCGLGLLCSDTVLGGQCEGVRSQ